MKNRRFSFLTAGAFLVSILFAPSSSSAQTELEQLVEEFKAMRQKMETMQKRIEELETQQTQVKETVSHHEEQIVKQQGQGISTALNWRGYFSWNYQDETKRGANPTFDAFALALIPKVTLNEKIDIYSQLVFEHAPFHDIDISAAGVRAVDSRSSGEFVVNDAYLTYALTDWLKFRAGKFATPFGWWNTLQYAAPTYITIKQPGRDTFYSRGDTTDVDANLFGRYSMGAWLLGNYDIFSYDLYVANGRTVLDQHKDDNRDKAFGLRLGADVPVGSAKLKVLYSHYQDKLRTTNTQAFYDQQTDAFSTEFTSGDLKLMSEYANSKRQGIFMDAFYLLGQYNLGEKFIPFLQYQHYEPNRKRGEDGTNYYTAGLAYQIIPWRTLLKFQVDKVKPEDNSAEEYNRYLLGLAAAF